MTMVENKLLRSKRAQTVPQQDVWLARMFVLRDDPKRNHVLDELIKTAGAEFTKTARGFCGQPMTSVIVAVNDKVCINQFLSQLRIAVHMLAESVGDLNDSANIVTPSPFYAGNGETVRTFECESFWLSHTSFTRD